MKKLLIMVAACALLLSMTMGLTACGKDGGASNTGDNASGNALIFDEDAEIALGTPTSSVDPAAIYASTTYDYRMFYGSYRIEGGSDGEQEYASSMPQVTYKGGEGTNRTVCALPYKFVAGPHTWPHVINYIPGKHFMEAGFYNADGYMEPIRCAYTVSGNTLTLNPIEEYEYDDATKRIRYSMSDIFWDYTFTFCGTTLTLSDGTNTITLKSGLDITEDAPYFDVANYWTEGSERIDGLDYFRLRWDNDEKGGRFAVEDMNEEYPKHGVAKLEDNGRLTFTIPTESGTKTYSFVYWYCYSDGLILSDGQKVYYYNDASFDRYGNKLKGSISAEEMQQLSSISEEELQKIVETKANLLADLSAAFNEAGLAVTINEATGEIAMDASVLFAVNDYTVSEEGKALLKQFMNIYCSVVFDEKYEGFVSSIMVEGHTDSDGDYDANLTLSQNRADSVKDFCLSSDCVVDAYASKLTSMLTPVGYSYEQPILDENGNEDKEASRRVSFRFLINLEG